MQEPILLNRSFMSWYLLLFSILDVILAINTSYKPLAIMLMFVAGLCVSNWIFDGIYQSQHRLIHRSLNLVKEMLDKMQGVKNAKTREARRK